MHQIIEHATHAEHWIDGTLRATIELRHLAAYRAGVPELAADLQPQPSAPAPGSEKATSNRRRRR
jgi:hypothetical protein